MRRHRHPPPATSPDRPRRGHRLRVRSLLMLVVLVPTLGLVAVATISAKEAVARRDAAQHTKEEADILADLVDTRVTIAREHNHSSVVSIASDLGLGVEELSEFTGVDYTTELRAARAAVDADAVVATLPALDDDPALLQELRTGLDAGTATFVRVDEVFESLNSGLDHVRRAHLARLQDELGSGNFAGSLHDRANAVRGTFDALSWGSRRAALAVQLLLTPSTPDALAQMLHATTRQRTATEDIGRLLGPAATAAWEQHESDPATRRFERTLDDVAQAFLTGTPSPLSTGPEAFGEAFDDGEPWAAGLSDLTRAAAADLRDEARHQEEHANQALMTQVTLAAVLAVLSVAGALVLARSVTRPVRRLEAAAHQINQGRFDVDPIDASGPRELSDTAAAFNEMTTSLAAVETYAVALADEPGAPVLDHPIPGRTGRALQVALNRLRASIRAAEAHRRELHDAATHDGLTGLLNRTAALAMIEHDLARAERTDGTVMVLFIDVDGLKPINDEHGHAAGDDALRLVAEALRAATRQSDVVARLGGDEFLVAGITDGPGEVEHLAERIREAIAARTLAGATGPIPLHCSVGMASSGPAATTVDTLIRRADAALYVAKDRGRNQMAWDVRPDTGGTSARGPRP